MYNDYFAKDYDKNDYDTNTARWRYNKWIADRLYDRTKNTGNTQMGYFMYLDAADTPGTIANIKLPDDLCPDMKLVVSAWICDMAFKVYNPDDDNVVSNADVSFSFKGITASGDEVILNRYQSGRISNNPYEFGRRDYEQANWQQIYFSFTFERPEEEFVSYAVEIANNAASSTGADYAIDDIRIYRSTPSIEVIREDACDASTLTISSDYETLLANMDWTAGQDISDIQQVYGNAELIKYRFGLQGDANSNDYPVLEETFGNTYFSFLEGLYENENGNLVIGNYTNVTATNQEDKLGEKEYRWIRINKDLQVSAPAQSVYSLRVVVSTEKDKIPNTYQAAQEEERKRNFRALKDYNYAVDNWDAMWEDSESVPNKPAWLNNKIEIPPSTPLAQYRWCALARDADKIDVFRMVQSRIDNGTIYDMLPRHKRVTGLTPALVEEVRATGRGSYLNARSLQDYRLIQLTWGLDLNFPVSAVTLREEGIFDRIAEDLK